MLEKVLKKEDGHEKTPKDQKKPVSIVLELSKKMFTNCSDGLNMFENFVFGVWKYYGNEFEKASRFIYLSSFLPYSMIF